MTRKTAVIAGAGLLVVVALLVTLTLVLLPGGGSTRGRSGAQAPKQHASAHVTVAGGGSVALADGTRVVIPPGAVSTDTTLRLAHDRKSSPTAVKGSASAGDPVHITLDEGTLTSRVTVVLPVTRPAGLPADRAGPHRGGGPRQGAGRKGPARHARPAARSPRLRHRAEMDSATATRRGAVRAPAASFRHAQGA